jgi:hypothetical protein
LHISFINFCFRNYVANARQAAVYKPYRNKQKISIVWAILLHYQHFCIVTCLRDCVFFQIWYCEISFKLQKGFALEKNGTGNQSESYFSIEIYRRILFIFTTSIILLLKNDVLDKWQLFFSHHTLY